MEKLKRIGQPWIFFMVLCLSIHTELASAQLTGVPDQLNDDNNNRVLPIFFDREPTIGSPYLVGQWARGTVTLSGNHQMPDPDQSLWFNFDKVKNVLFIVNSKGQRWTYPIDSISSFSLIFNGEMNTFEKISWISNNYFLMPMFRSEKGYSLYKRLFTKCIPAVYANAGYYEEGKRYDEYLDFYEYYITYPGNTSYRKLYLRENPIRRTFRAESGLLEEFFNLHDREITEQSLLGLIQYIDDHKFPE